jgi:hypothetical protein
MKTLANTTENKNLITALKTINECQWVGNVTFERLDECLEIVKKHGYNSGHYNPKPIRIKGLLGIYITNQDGSLFYEDRIVKQGNQFKVETLSKKGFEDFEAKFRSL